MIRTRPTRSPALNTTPRNENVSLPAPPGRLNVPSERDRIEILNCGSIRQIYVRKTTPKALVEAGVVVPARKKLVSLILLPMLVKSFGLLNGSKVAGYVGFRFMNWTPAPAVDSPEIRCPV